MPRLLHIMDFKPLGTRTMDDFILLLAMAFRKRGWEVCYAFGAEPPENFARALGEAGARYEVISFPFTWDSARELVRKLDGFRPDVTQTSFLSAFCVPLLALKWKRRLGRLVVIDHSSGDVVNRRGWKRWATAARGWVVGQLVDAIVPVSRAVARRDIKKVFLPARKVRVIHNGIRLDLFRRLPRTPRDIARVVFAGQLVPEKGVMTLLRAHVRLRNAGMLNHELLIAGKGAQESELKAYCAAAGCNDVRFLGHVDSVAALFASADVVVVPSVWYEAFGLVVAEAMACGAALLVSDAGALPEVVGDAGRVFKAGDDADLADRLKQLIDDPATRQRLGEIGRQRVEAVFTIDRMVDGHVAVCEKVQRGEALADLHLPNDRDMF